MPLICISALMSLCLEIANMSTDSCMGPVCTTPVCGPKQPITQLVWPRTLTLYHYIAIWPPCIQAWRPYRKKNIDMLERVQRRATKMIPKLRNISYEMRLKECGLTTLETRRLRGDQIEVFKILNGYENIDRNIFFTVKEERRTRGHGVTLAKKQCRLDIRKFSFSQRTVNEWNRLSADCVGASSVNIFKNKIDIYLRRAGYT